MHLKEEDFVINIIVTDFLIKKVVAFAQRMNGGQAEDTSLQSHRRED